MGPKLTKEQQEHLLKRIEDVMADDVLCAGDAIAILNVLLDACEREKEAIDPMGFIGEFLQ